MTAAQEKAFQQVTEILREHFSAGVLVVETENPEDDKMCRIETTWHGGYATAVGLLELGKSQVWRTEKDESQNEEST